LSVLVLETGLGATRTERALRWVLDAPKLGTVPYRPKMILSAGFAGSLSEELHVGDIVLAEEIADEQGGLWQTTWPKELPAGEWRPLLHRGRLLTVDRIVASPEEKRVVGMKHGAIAADMESATVARLCTERGIAFGCIRAISDDMRTPLSPRLASLLRDGRVDPFRLLGSLFLKPTLIRELWRLARHTSFAGEQLGTALGELLTLTTPYGNP
jgi:adenosylhomocysteine nucleosidase